MTSPAWVLANAVHLDAELVSPFTPDSTRPDEFTRGDGRTVAAEFMHQTLHARYGEAGGVQAIVLPYTNGYEMVVAVPPEGELPDLEHALADSGGLDAVLGQLADREVVLSLPKWDIETRTDLVALQTLGMTLPFDCDRADFTNITSEIPLAVSGVIHQANIGRRSRYRGGRSDRGHPRLRRTRRLEARTGDDERRPPVLVRHPPR
jgi:serine protease inhibitor